MKYIWLKKPGEKIYLWCQVLGVTTFTMFQYWSDISIFKWGMQLLKPEVDLSQIAFAKLEFEGKVIQIMVYI